MSEEVKAEEIEVKTEPVGDIKNPDNKKRNKRALKWGCGCLTILIVVPMVFGIINSCNITPKERKEQEAKRIEAKAEKAKDARRERQGKAEKRAVENARKEQERQFDRAEKLKIPALVAAQTFVKDRLKSPTSAKFGGYNSNSVAWWKDNIFLATVVVDSQNSFGAMIRSTFMCELEFFGKDTARDWRLLAIGTPKQIMSKKMREKK